MQITIKPNTYYRTTSGKKAFVQFQACNPFPHEKDDASGMWFGFIEGTFQSLWWSQYGQSEYTCEHLIEEWRGPHLHRVRLYLYKQLHNSIVLVNESRPDAELLAYKEVTICEGEGL